MFRVNSFYSDMTYDVVQVLPALLDWQNVTNLLNYEDSFFDDGLGGEVQSSVVIRRSSQPYNVTRSIFVRYDYTTVQFLITKVVLQTNININA